MFKNFWIYFNTFPVLLGIFAFYKINSFQPRGKFEDAVDYCKDVDNEYMFDEGTEQDFCIDHFMMGSFNEAIPWMILFLLGVVFILPLCFYLAISLRKNNTYVRY